MCEDHYLPNEFDYIQYEASSGGLGSVDSDARHTYYSDNGTGIPDIRLDGSWFVQAGAPPSDADGQAYIALIDQRRSTQAPMAVFISDYSLTEPGAFAEVTVKMFADIPTSDDHMVRVAIVEDDLTYGGSTYQNVCRDMLPDAAGTPLTVSTAGEEQVLDLDIAMQTGWNPDKLQIIAWVQRDTDKLILQSGNSSAGEFGAAASVDGPQQVVADGGVVTFGTASIVNTGVYADTFDVALDTSGLPEGWTAHLSYGGGDVQQFSVPLDPYGSADFAVVMDTGTVGSAGVTVTITSQGSGDVVETVEFRALAGGTDILVVSDDGADAHGQAVYGPAVGATGLTYAVWDLDMASLSSADLLDYDAVVWQTGSNGNAMQAGDRAAIDEYLYDGGRMILAGEDLIESLYRQGGSARFWYQGRLRFNYISGSSNNLDIVGMQGDPIGDGVAFTLTGGDPDVPFLITNQPVEVSCEYGDGDPAVLRTDYLDYKIVFFPFGLERVPTQELADDLIHDSLDWLGVLGVTGADTPATLLSLRQNVPNPFNPQTTIAFSLDHAGPARLEVFDARGQLVRVLADDVLVPGPHEFVWTGRTDAGRRAASGTYFYRLTTAGESMTRKMLLVK